MKYLFSMLLASTLFLSSCSMACLAVSDAVSPNEDSDNETEGKVEIFNLKASPTYSGTTLSWDDYSYGTGDDKRTVSRYYVLRSSISPWEGFTQVDYKSDSSLSSTNLWTDDEVTFASRTVYYRIKCTYSVSTDDGTKKYMVLSEAVKAP